MIEQLNTIARLWWSWSIAMLWQVGLLILVIATIDRLIRRWAWPQLRYALWSLILVKLLLPPSLSLPSGIVPGLAPAVRQALVRLQSEKPVAAEGRVLFSLNEDMLRVPALAPDGIGESARSVPVRAYLETPYGVATNGLLRSTAEAPSSVFIAWQVYPMMASLAGTLILGIWLFLRLHSLVGRHSQVAAAASLPQSFYNQLADCARRLELRSVPRVVVTKRLATPAVFGVFRPVLLMPRGYLSKLSRRDTEHMLLHELAHVKRGDLFAHSLYMLLQIVYWYNPLLWLVRRQMHHLRELSCDATVAELLRERTMAYRQTLLETARRLLTSSVEPGLGLLGLFEDSNRLLVRLNWLTKPTWRYRTMKRVTVATIAALMLACVLPMARAQEAASEREERIANRQETQLSQQMAELQARLDQLKAEQEQLQKALQALGEKRHQLAGRSEQTPHLPAAGDGPRRERASAEIDVTVVPRDVPASMEGEGRPGARDERARVEVELKRARKEADRAAAMADKAKIEAKRAEQMGQRQADLEKWQNSDEMKRWQQEMEQWGKKMERRYEQGDGEAAAGGQKTAEPMPPMPPMPTMPAMPPVQDTTAGIHVAPPIPHVSATPRPEARVNVKVTVPHVSTRSEPSDLPDGDRAVDLQLPERVTLVNLLNLVGKQTGMNYIYDPKYVTGEVSVRLGGRLTGTVRVKDLYKLLDTVLEDCDLTMVRCGGNIVAIVPKSEEPGAPRAPAAPAPTPRSVPAPLQEDMDIEVEVPEAPAEVAEVPDVPDVPEVPSVATIPHEQLQQMDAQMQQLQKQIRQLGEQRQQMMQQQLQRVNEQIQEQQKNVQRHRGLLQEQRGRIQEQQEQLRQHARDLPQWQDDENLEEATSRQEVTEPLAPDQTLEIINEFGSIAVRGGDGDSVRIVATIKGRAETMDEAQAIVDQARLDIGQSEETLRVAMAKPANQQEQEKIRRRVDFEVVVPRDARIKVSQSFGDVRLNDLSGSVQAVTNMGSVRAAGVSGRVALAANFGEIDFVAPPHLSARVQANAQFGDIHSDLPLQVVKPGEFSMGSQVSGTIGEGQGKISLSTNMGSIRIRSEDAGPNEKF